MSTSKTTDYGDFTETVEGEPTWQNPTVWYSVRRDYKAGTPDANATTLQQQGASALDTNRTYTALTSPTNAQVAAQVKALTRQNTALIRLVLGRLDGTD